MERNRPGWARCGASLVFAVALGAAALQPALSATAGGHGSAARVVSFELPSAAVDTSAPGGRLADGRVTPKVNVLLPAGYDRPPLRRYPVLWLLHGGSGGSDNWLPGVSNLVAGLPAIVVMPDGGLFGMYTDWWNAGARDDPAWASYHLQTLRDTLERRYRILPGRRWHAIAGISMGGQGALRYAAMLPGYFGSVAAFSAALPDMQAPVAEYGLALLASVDGGTDVTYEAIFGPASDAYAEGNNPQALTPNYGHTRLYVTAGNGTNCPQDPVNPGSITVDTIVETTLFAQQAPFAAAARAAGADVTEVPTCGVHTFGVWDRAFAAARAWGFFGPVPERPQHWTYRTIATAGEMWGLEFHFDEPPTTVAEFSRAGHMLTATGRGRVRIQGPRSCSLTADLPFRRQLPQACLDAENAKVAARNSR